MKKDFESADAVAIGLSADTLEAQQKFTDDHKLTTPLMADPEKKLLTALGAKGRTTFVIDKDGKIAKVYAGKIDTKAHAAEVLEFVKTLGDKK